MALILNIETATAVLSVSLGKDGDIVNLMEINTQNRHAEKITLFIDELLRKSAVSFDDLDAVAVSEGPGSYTGLRIGVSTAKGICYSKDIPLVAVSTLKAMALSMASLSTLKEKDKQNALFCPMVDARRMRFILLFLIAKTNKFEKYRPILSGKIAIRISWKKAR